MLIMTSSSLWWCRALASHRMQNQWKLVDAYPKPSEEKTTSRGQISNNTYEESWCGVQLHGRSLCGLTIVAYIRIDLSGSSVTILDGTFAQWPVGTEWGWDWFLQNGGWIRGNCYIWNALMAQPWLHFEIILIRCISVSMPPVRESCIVNSCASWPF